MIDPTIFIAPYALGYALFILFLYLAVRTKKKILEEGKHYRGIPTLMFILASIDAVYLFYFGMLLFMYLSFIGLALSVFFILIPLILTINAYTNTKRIERIEYEVIHRKMSLIELVGIVGPILVLIGCLMLAASTVFGFFSLQWAYAYIFDKLVLSILFTSIFTILSIVGVILGKKGKSYGCYICLGAGIFLIVGSFIYYRTGSFPFINTYYLTQSLITVDPYLVLIGGILSVIAKKNLLSYYTERQDFTEKVINIEDEIDKIEDLKGFLQERLGSDWEKIKISFEAYQAGELDKSTFIGTAVKNIGHKFIEIFKPNKRGELNEV